MISDFLRSLVRDRLQASQDSEVQILRGDAGVLDPASGHVGGMANARTLYQGPARIGALTAGAPITLGDTEVATRQASISIPITAATPHLDDLVKVLDCPADPDMAGRVFRIDSVEGAGFGAERRLGCTGLFESRQWSP